MAASKLQHHGLIHWAVLIVISAVLISSGCLDDDDDEESNSAPVAKASANPTTVEMNFEIQFSGDGSSDPDSDPLTFRWDFDASDGKNHIDSMLKNPKHSYSEDGTYVVILTVSDGKLSDTTEITVTVAEPQGDLSAEITTEDETKGTVHETERDIGNIHEETIAISFSGEDSEDTHPDSEIEKYEWDYVLEGAFEADESGEEGSYDYKSGRYTTMLQVTNTTGHTARDSTTIYVNYNESYNLSVDADTNRTVRFPVNTAGAIKLHVKLSYDVSNIGGLDEDDLELYLYDAKYNEIADTETQENGSEELTLSSGDIYQNGGEASIGAWRLAIENQNDVVDKDCRVWIDVMYYNP